MISLLVKTKRMHEFHSFFAIFYCFAMENFSSAKKLIFTFIYFYIVLAMNNKYFHSFATNLNVLESPLKMPIFWFGS